MKLNLHILFDELQSYSPTLHATDSTALDIEGARLLNDGLIDPNMVYIVSSDRHLSVEQGKMLSHVIFVGNAEWLEGDSLGWQWIVISSEVDYLEVFSSLQDVFEKYDRWEHEVLSSVVRPMSLKRILELGVHPLKNPVALFDASGALVLNAGSIPQVGEDSIWDEVLKDGFTHFEMLKPKEQHHVNALLSAHGDEPFFFRTERFQTETELVAILRHHGQAAGTLGCVDICEPFTLGQASLLRALRDLMELEFETGPELFKLLGDMTPLIDYVLDGEDVDRGNVEARLAQHKWRMDDDYLVMFLSRCNNDPFSEASWNSITNSVMSCLAPVYAEPRSVGLAILFRGDKPLDIGDLVRRAAPLLRSLGLVGGFSAEFNDFMVLPRGLEQAMLVTKTMHEDDMGMVFSLEERYKACVLEGLGSAHPLKNYCHPAIASEYRSGEKGRELVQTLFVYLLCGNNVSEAARRLHLHRNTMVYRLEQLRRVCGFDFDHAGENQLLFILTTCMILQESDCRKS